MLQALSVLKSGLSTGRRTSESFVFFLHYRVTFLALMFACVLVSANHFIGERIRCHAGRRDDLDLDLINAYCWATSTYSVNTAYFKEIGVEVPHPGVGGSSEDESEYTYRNYYQYVHLVLFLQAVLFYIPHLIWKSIDKSQRTHYYEAVHKILAEDQQDIKQNIAKDEQGNDQDKDRRKQNDLPMEKAAQQDIDQNIAKDEQGNDQDKGRPKRNDFKTNNNQAKDDKEKNMEKAATYIEERWGMHRYYAFKYILCEMLSVFNLMVQSYLLDVFFQGDFFTLGHFYTSHYFSQRLKDPIKLFPIVTSCYFKKFGASGFVDTVDALCVLPINALNVKIYLFMWAWFIALLVISYLNLMILVISFFLPPSRILFPGIDSLMTKNHVDMKSYRKVIGRGDFGDWFVLKCVKSNMDPLEFSHLMDCLWSKLVRVGVESKIP